MLLKYLPLKNVLELFNFEFKKQKQEQVSLSMANHFAILITL